MNEYIKREDAIKITQKRLDVVSAYIDICKLPAADVAPVAHGKWLNEDFPEKTATVNDFAICSVCGEMSHKAEHGYAILSKYCPECGAKMDLE